MTARVRTRAAVVAESITTASEHGKPQPLEPESLHRARHRVRRHRRPRSRVCRRLAVSEPEFVAVAEPEVLRRRPRRCRSRWTSPSPIPSPSPSQSPASRLALRAGVPGACVVSGAPAGAGAAAHGATSATDRGPRRSLEPSFTGRSRSPRSRKRSTSSSTSCPPATRSSPATALCARSPSLRKNMKPPVSADAAAFRTRPHRERRTRGPPHHDQARAAHEEAGHCEEAIGLNAGAGPGAAAGAHRDRDWQEFRPRLGVRSRSPQGTPLSSVSSPVDPLSGPSRRFGAFGASGASFGPDPELRSVPDFVDSERFSLSGIRIRGGDLGSARIFRDS